MEGYDDWIAIKNLPLDHWCCQSFEAIGEYFGGFVRVSSETLNMTMVFEARIQVMSNLCGFMPATIEIKDSCRRNIYLHFGDVSIIDSPNVIH